MDPRVTRPVLSMIMRTTLFKSHPGVPPHHTGNIVSWTRQAFGGYARDRQAAIRYLTTGCRTSGSHTTPGERVKEDNSKSPQPESGGEGAAKPEGEGSSEAKEEGGTEVEQKLRFELNKAVTESATLLSKSRDFEDKYKRALAESENMRTRLTKQISDAKLYAVQGFCKDMTEISDILRMAIDSVPKEQLNNDNPHLKSLYDGLAMTESRLFQVFKSHGLVQLNPVDEKFNPNEHEAVVHQPMEGKESGTVIFVSKLGYKLHDRVIRPAVVGVAK